VGFDKLDKDNKSFLDGVKVVVVDEPDVTLPPLTTKLNDLSYEQIILTGVTMPSSQVIKSVAKPGINFVTTSGSMDDIPEKKKPESESLNAISNRICVTDKPLLSLVRLVRETGNGRCLIYFHKTKLDNDIVVKVRDGLWSYKFISVLKTDGIDPMRAYEDFSHYKSNCLLLAEDSGRGLDLAGVEHVFVMYPTEAEEYVHLAGRVGRLGQFGSGVVTTIGNESVVNKVREISKELDFKLIEVDEPKSAVVEGDEDSMKRYEVDMEELV
jgi:superfamily II DNA/RNA helicase